MADREEGFLGRWSRLKQADRKNAPETEPVAAAAALPEAAAAVDEPADSGSTAPAVPELPPVESLDRDSDFTAFLQPGVPPELRSSALRKLWRSDPLLANLDGLLEYGDDFTLPWKNSKGVVATAYRVGKGMVESLTAESREDAVTIADAAAESETESAKVAGDSADAKGPQEEPGGASSKGGAGPT